MSDARLDRTFEFRGDRKYLQSASLFDDLIALRGIDVRDIDFRFHHKTGNQVSYVDAPAEGETVVADWADSRGKVFVVERAEPIVQSTPYDEPALVARFTLDGDCVRLPADIGPFTRIEALVAGFKFLLQRRFPDTPRKYVFVRSRLRFLPEQAMDVCFARTIGEFFQADIRADGAPIGQIFFGEWR